MANIQGCFNCEFFKAKGSRPKSHVPGTKYHGVCGNSARPNNSGEMSILMTEDRPNASEGCEYHSGNLTQRAADASPEGFEDEEFDALLDSDIDGK